jgi:glutaredoxin 3
LFVTINQGIPESMLIKIYTRNHCSFCYAAKRLLTKRGIGFEEISLADDSSREQEMTELTGRTSVPQIIIDGKPIGGYTELVEMDMEGELERQQ